MRLLISGSWVRAPRWASKFFFLTYLIANHARLQYFFSRDKQFFGQKSYWIFKRKVQTKQTSINNKHAHYNSKDSSSTIEQKLLWSSIVLFIKSSISHDIFIDFDNLNVFKTEVTLLKVVKFMFSKKSTKIEEIFTINLTLFSKCQIDGEDFFNFCGLLRKHELYILSKNNYYSDIGK